MLELILIILGLKALWIASAMLQALIEAHYHDMLYYLDRKHKNLHWAYTCLRGVVLIALVWAVSGYVSPANTFIFAVSCFFSYSFFHNGMLYSTRNNLNSALYQKRWRASKEAGDNRNSANVEISAGFRTAMFVVSILLLIAIILDSYL